MARRLFPPFAYLLFVMTLISPLTPLYTVRAATITVTNTADSGAGSLRAAIASASSGDTIVFNITGEGVQTIVPTAPLPNLASGVIIDGLTQPGSSAGNLLIELNGENAGNSANGLGLSGSNTVRGLVINRFSGTGIYVYSNSGNIIEGNIIGLNPAGTAALGNVRGITLDQASGNRIGGTTVGARNIISGNSDTGVNILGSSATNNTVQGNYIGTDITGNVALGNGYQGIFVNNAPNNLIGGTAAGAGNVISANDGGIMIFDASDGTTIQGNLIGTNAAGTAALGNNHMGFWIANAQHILIGGTTPGARNVISGNGPIFAFGIYFNENARNNTVQGNFIGTDITGTQAIGNGTGGVAMMRSSDNLIGGNTPAARNIISGNIGVGVAIAGNGLPGDPVTPSDNNVIQGNYIGTDVTGTVAVPNQENGINVSNGFGNGVHNNIIGGSGPGEGNLISGNGSAGIIIDTGAVGTQVLGNIIGLNATGTASIPNNPNGVIIPDGVNSTIGGTTVGAGNVIAGNVKGIVVVQYSGTANQNQILGNSIYANTILGIDLGDDGVTENDAGDTDDGANNMQNTPVLTGAETTNTTIQISGTLNSQASKIYRVEFFANPVCHPSGSGEGKFYLGFVNVTTNSSGQATFTKTVAVTIPVGQFVTATATDPTHNTSEFSACSVVSSPPGAVPARNAFTTAAVNVSWSSVSWATGYIIEWDDNIAFSSPTFLPAFSPTQQSVVITVPGSGVYYWRVRALNNAGTMTTWSNTESFTVTLP